MKSFRIWVSILVVLVFAALAGCGGGSGDGVRVTTNKQFKITTEKEKSESDIPANKEHKAQSSSAEITIPANSISSNYDLSINKINTANLDSATLSYLKSYFGFDENVQFFSPIINFDISLVNNTSNIFRGSINIDSDGFVLNNIAEILIKSDKVLSDWVNLHYYLAFCTESNGKWHFTPLKKEHFEKKLDQLCFKINKVGKLYVIIALPYEINTGLVPELPDFTDTGTNTNTSTSSATSTNTQTQTNTNTDTDTDLVTYLNIYANPDILIASDSGKFNEDMELFVTIEYSGNNPFVYTTPTIEFLSFTSFDLGDSIKSNYYNDYYVYNYKSFISPQSEINGIATFVLTLPTKNVKYDSDKHPANIFATAKFKSKSNKDYESEPIKISFIYNSPIGKNPPSNLVVNTTFPNNSNYLNGSASIDLSLTWSGDAMPFTANFKHNNSIIYSVASITDNSLDVDIPVSLTGDADGEKHIEVQLIDSSNRSTSALSKTFIIDREYPVLVASITNGSIFSVRDNVQILISSNKTITNPDVFCEGINAILSETLASNTRFIYNLQLNSDFTNGEHQINIVASDTTEPVEFANSGSAFATFTVDTSIQFPFANGSGTASDPFLIATAEDLNNVRYYPDYYYKQVADIDLNEFISSRTDSMLYPSESDTNSTVGWLPIDGFSKIYDGDNHKITNLIIDRFDRDNVGLFGLLAEKAMIKNININSYNALNRVYGRNYTGLIVGSANNNIIENCHVSGYASGTECVGGIAGIANQITNCSVEETFIAGKAKVGGIVGQGKIINNCQNNGWGLNSNNQSDISESFGGIAGVCIDGEITDCISSNMYLGFWENSINSLGGIVGDLTNSNIVKCSNNSDIKQEYNSLVLITNIGGIVGRTNGNNNKITNCHYEGEISFSGNNINNIGGILGYNNCNGLEIANSSSNSNCNFTINTNSYETSLIFGGIVGSSESPNMMINRCFSRVIFNINQNNYYATGICGNFNDGTISNCIAFTDTKSFGIAGLGNNYINLNYPSTLYNNIKHNIINCLAISNNAIYAGIFYNNYDNKTNVSNCFVVNDSSEANPSYYNRIVNGSDDSQLSNNYGWNTENINGERLANNKNGADAIKSEFWGASTQQSFWENKLGWDFDNIWEFRNGYNLPQLQGLPSVPDPDFLVNAN